VLGTIGELAQVGGAGMAAHGEASFTLIRSSHQTQIRRYGHPTKHSSVDMVP